MWNCMVVKKNNLALLLWSVKILINLNTIQSQEYVLNITSFILLGINLKGRILEFTNNWNISVA